MCLKTLFKMGDQDFHYFLSLAQGPVPSNLRRFDLKNTYCYQSIQKVSYHHQEIKKLRSVSALGIFNPDFNSRKHNKKQSLGLPKTPQHPWYCAKCHPCTGSTTFFTFSFYTLQKIGQKIHFLNLGSQRRKAGE